MAWRRPGDKPLSEPMLVFVPTHICVTRPQWVSVRKLIQEGGGGGGGGAENHHPPLNSPHKGPVMVNTNIFCAFFPKVYWTNSRIYDELERRVVYVMWCHFNYRQNRSVSNHDKTQGNPYRIMMASSNGNIFRVTGHLCGKFTGNRWIPLTKASDVDLWCFLWSAPEQTVG